MNCAADVGVHDDTTALVFRFCSFSAASRSKSGYLMDTSWKSSCSSFGGIMLQIILFGAFSVIGAAHR